MSRRVSFKLYDKDAAGNPLDELRLALAFQRHCHVNLGVSDDLNLLVKKVFLKFLLDSVDKAASDKHDLSTAGVPNAEAGNAQGNTEGTSDSSNGEPSPERAARDAVAQPQGVDDSSPATPG